MHILITGAAGFIGQLLAKELLSDPKHTVLLADIIKPPIPQGAKHPENATALALDLVTSSEQLPLSTVDAAFVFHGIMSAGSEENFDLGLRVNVTATQRLLEAMRAAGAQRGPGRAIRVVYASSQAVYGQPLPAVVDEAVVATPESSYGAEKMVCEILLNEYTRRGFIDGLALRFPTVVVRPGKPTQAASSFLSGMIREPLNGQPCVIPLQDRDFRSWVCSPRSLVANLQHALVLPADALPSHTRILNVPGISVTVQEMMDALRTVAGDTVLSLVSEHTQPELEKILRSWPTRFDNKLAYSLGFQPDGSFEQAVRDYKESLS